MSRRKKQENHESRPDVLSPSRKSRDVSTAFEMPPANSANFEQAAMARGMQEWLDSFNKSRDSEDDEDETVAGSSRNDFS